MLISYINHYYIVMLIYFQMDFRLHHSSLRSIHLFRTERKPEQLPVQTGMCGNLSGLVNVTAYAGQ